MDGIHDLGGTEGFGTPEVETDEPVFHHAWEGRALGLTFTGAGLCSRNTSQFRHSIERMRADHYLTSRYYEHWLTGITTLLVEAGIVTVDELESRAGGAYPLSLPIAPTGVHGPPPPGGDLALGDGVRVRNIDTRGHTRCPSYVRGRRGTVVRVDHVTAVPDVEAHVDDPRAEPIYTVRFDSTELWGADAEAGCVHVDLWHSYLERETREREA